MPRPIVEIAQRVANITPTITSPQQKVVLVGPKYDLRVYDPAVADNSASEVISDYAPFVGSNVANINFDPGSEPEWVVSGLSSQVDEVGHTPKFYIEDAEFAVVFQQESGIPSLANDFAAESSESHRRLYFGDRSTNWEDLRASVGAPFSPEAGDTIHIHHKIASKVVYDGTFSSTHTSVLSDPASTYTLSIDGGGAQAVKVIDFDTSESAVYLHSTEVTAAAAGSTFALKVFKSNGDLAFEFSALSQVPGDQRLLISERSGAEIVVSAPIRSFPISTNADDKKLDFRVDRAVSSYFGLATDYIEIHPTDDQDPTGSTLSFEWDSTDSEVYIKAHNAPDLRDTSIPNIKNTLTANMTHHVLTGGKVFSTFRSLVSNDSTTIREVNSTNIEDLGTSNPLNPLGLAANIAVANTGTTSINVLALESDSVAGYTKALGILSGDPDVYAIVPLSDDLNNVILPYTSEAERLSQPNKSKFRIVIGASTPCPTRKYLAGSEKVNATGQVFVHDQGYLLVDLEASFVASGVSTASVLTVGGEDYSISKVLDDSRILVPNEGNAGLGALVGVDSVEYTVSSDISTDRVAQVDVLTKRLDTITSKRLVMVYPGTCAAQGFLDLPGYYLSSAIGAMLAVFEPHRPKNNILLAGIDSISTSNLGFFTDSQIDQLSDAGYFVLVQDTADGAPFCVHQVTVAYQDFTETQELGELSVLNNYDYVSKYLGNALSPFVGTWNVTPQAVSTIHATLDAALIRLQSQWTDVIGSPVLNYSIQNVSVSQTSRGTINVSVSVSLPRVLNTIVLEIVSE
jgi:hypothetical protein